MKITKIMVLLCLSFCLIFSSCRNHNNETMVSSNESVSTPVLEIQEADDLTDPENAEKYEDGLGQGSKVKVQQIKNKKGKLNGIDVSHWQGKIDWKAVKADGIDFAIIRIGYRGENGKLYRDSSADYNIQQAQKSGILVGVYFFSTATNKKEAEEEASFVVDAIKAYKISCPVAYDCEGFLNPESRMFNLTAEERTDNAVTFLNKIKKSGYDPIFYGAKSEIENGRLWDTQLLESKYDIWLAYYSSPTYPEIETPDYNGKYDMWQFTNRGSVKGIDGNCDLIVSYKKFKEATAKDENAKLPTASIPKTEEEKLYTDVSDKVTAKEVTNLRAGAGTNFEIVGTLKSGEFVKRTGIGKNGWSRLKYNGKTVYAITSYLTDEVIEIPQKDIVNGMEFTPKNDKVTAKIEVNLRSMPTTDSESVGKLLSGTFLKRTAISNNGWSRLDYNGKTVYAVSSYLTTEKTEISIVPSEDDEIKEHGMVFMKVKETRVTAKEITNLRDKPTTDSNIVHALQNGEYVIRNALSSNGWARLEYDGKIVYAVDSFLLNAE